MNKQTYLKLRKEIDTQPKSYFLYLHILQDAVLISINYFLLTHLADSNYVFLSIPIFATLMFRNFSLMHDAVHGLVSKNKMINDTVGVISGGLCFLPYEPWKQVHLEHHYWSGNIEKDPVMALVRNFPSWDNRLKSSFGFLWNAWIPMLALAQYAVFWLLSIVSFLKKPSSFKSLASVVFPGLLIGALCYAMKSGQALTLLLPSIALYLLAVEVVNFPHHVGLPYIDGDEHLPVWEQHITARSCVYPVWLSRFVVLNFNYHIEHHMFPDVPWYGLAELQKAVSTELQEQYNIDPQFGWIKNNRGKSLAQIFRTEQRLREQPKKAA